MEENLKENTQIFYKRLNICKRFPINQVIKIQLPPEENEEAVSVSIGIVKGYLVLEKDVDNLKAGDFVLLIDTVLQQSTLIPNTLIDPVYCIPINEEFYPLSITENNQRNNNLKERLIISEEVHKLNIDIVKEFKLNSIVEVKFNISTKEQKENVDKYVLGKIIGYIHNFENEQEPGLLILQIELFPMKNDVHGYADNQILNISTNLCKLI